MNRECSARKYFRQFRSGHTCRDYNSKLKKAIEREPDRMTRELAKELHVSEKSACNNLYAFGK